MPDRFILDYQGTGKRLRPALLCKAFDFTFEYPESAICYPESAICYPLSSIRHLPSKVQNQSTLRLYREELNRFSDAAHGFAHFFLLFREEVDGSFLIPVLNPDFLDRVMSKIVKKIDGYHAGMLIKAHIGFGIESAPIGNIIKIDNLLVAEL